MNKNLFGMGYEAHPQALWRRRRRSNEIVNSSHNSQHHTQLVHHIMELMNSNYNNPPSPSLHTDIHCPCITTMDIINRDLLEINLKRAAQVAHQFLATRHMGQKCSCRFAPIGFKDISRFPCSEVCVSTWAMKTIEAWYV